ncbi:hypothetical protein [Pedobacter duraquae]|uniref:Outer membrane protein with beta-barrel domain n=1 Tax=Pedobacter duraquae TaxID=425511 RepID=A0A4R6IEJ9_9SPHI|nr:hypothetical protein [Pedobacter duraquae]TDO20720.1 hypothetical protein CLV32_3353 [Pedobacter duraquae]
MKRFLGIATLITLLSSISSQAQEKTGWAIKASINPGTTVIGGGHFVLGGGIGIEKTLNDQFTATLNSGYTHYFSYHTNAAIVTPTFSYFGDIEKDLELIPIKAGLNYFVNKQVYIGVDAGIGIETNGNSSFVYSPAIGIAMTRGIDLSVKYEDYTGYARSGQVALRLGYRFGL